MRMSATQRAYSWSVTISSPTQEQTDFMFHLGEIKDTRFKWFVCAQEYGDVNQNLHYQIAFSLKNAKTWTAVFKMLGLKGGDNLEVQRATQVTNVLYCKKGSQSKMEWDEDGVDGTNYGNDLVIISEFGNPPELGEAKRSQWDDIRRAVENGWSDMDICARWPQEGIRCSSAIAKYRLLVDRSRADWRNVQVIYIHGVTGTGKTRSVMQKYGYPNVYRVTDYGSGAFDMYDGQDVLVFEEFRSSFRLEHMLNYLDGHPVELPCRYANQLLKATKIFIITNIPLEEQYPKFHNGFESEGQKQSWSAFNRRISGVIEVSEGQTLSIADLPLLGEEE